MKDGIWGPDWQVMESSELITSCPFVDWQLQNWISLVVALGSRASCGYSSANSD